MPEPTEPPKPPKPPKPPEPRKPAEPSKSSKPSKPSPESSERSTEAAERVNAQSLATSVTAYLISGPVVFGGAGRGLDIWLGTRFCTVVGLLIGMALSLYVIWLRYGTD